MRETRLGYSSAQIALHWTIAVLVILQIVLHDGIIAAYAAGRGVGTATESELFLADLHVAFGIAIFALALLRVALRLRRGAPPPPQDEHPALRLAARATHLALYAIILLMPVTGGLAWFGGVEAMAELHSAGKVAILALVLLHIAGALYQHFVLKTDVLRRMVRPEG
ncbi:MAG: cytochrome b/b6 domain-containing protein [Defluviicoccus sp.]|nr:cytochrome b/b6 domain-containing protein [Defluviicoccus sp.]MDE0383975.1 cytochrome b/b6 domain-containing protein [Defluviicoccus sp.]